jgi:MinD-like ATPase involved in chromosome partitioning or flagellar assembly
VPVSVSGGAGADSAAAQFDVAHAESAHSEAAHSEAAHSEADQFSEALGTPAADQSAADGEPTGWPAATGDGSADQGAAAQAEPWPQGERTQLWPPAGEVQPGTPLGTAAVPGAWSAQSYETGQPSEQQPVPAPGEWPSPVTPQGQHPQAGQPAWPGASADQSAWTGFGPSAQQAYDPQHHDPQHHDQQHHDQQHHDQQHHDQQQYGQHQGPETGPGGPGPAGFQPQGPPPGQPTPTHGQGPGGTPTAADFAARRAHRPEAPKANQGIAGAVRRASFGLVKPAPGRREVETRNAIGMVRRNFGGLRQVTVVNPKGGAGKTVAVLMIGMTCGQQRGGYVLAWDNNETQGTLGMRAQQDFHARTVRDLLDDLDQFTGPTGRVGDLSKYVRAQGEAMFDVLASDESATAGEMLTSQAFAHIREVVSRFYKLIIVDTGNNVRAANWQSSIEATDQLVVPMSARGDSAETASRMLDHLDQTGRHDLVRDAVSVISMPASTKGVDLPAIRAHFAARTRVVLTAPYEPLLDSGEPIRYEDLSQRSRLAWLRIAAAVSEGL